MEIPSVIIDRGILSALLIVVLPGNACCQSRRPFIAVQIPAVSVETIKCHDTKPYIVTSTYVWGRNQLVESEQRPLRAEVPGLLYGVFLLRRLGRRRQKRSTL